MKETNQLIEGNIFKALIKLALPIMGTSFIQMAYNLTDMIWIGRVGSKAVAAVGTAGFYTWLAMAFILISRIGAGVGVAQSVGKKDEIGSKKYILSSIQINVFFALLYGICLITFRNNLIMFFNLGDSEVVNMATSYLFIIAFGIIFYFINPVFTAIFNGFGDSKTPFIINTIGLIINIILDPVLILGFGKFEGLGVKGAAIATISAQFIVTIIFIYYIKRKIHVFSEFNLFKLPDYNYIKHTIKMGVPVALQSGLFTIFTMLIARVIANWGEIPIAVQKVGSQIEAISWMTSDGFSTALATFVGQNYGAKKWDRIYKGYFTAIGIVSIIGIVATCLLMFGARPIFSIFIPEEEAIKCGIVYLKILGLSQLFMCIEITTAGAFNGLGKTMTPAVIGIIFTGLRVPASIILTSDKLLGLKGAWWSISMSSILKGVILATLFILFLIKHPQISGKKMFIKEKEIEI